MKNKISIIVPVYNVENYIKKCLDSLIYQTYKNIEIILIDDGSTDKSGSICEEYASVDSRIIVIHQENMGLSCARNKGLDIASGEYIGFVDSDDWVAKNMYEILLNIALEYRADLVECGYEELYFDVENIQNQCFDIIENKIFIATNVQALQEELKWGRFTTIACNKLYKRKLFGGYRYPVGKVHEDEYLTYKLLYESDILVSINEIKLYYYLKNREGSITSKFTEKNLDIYDAYEEKIEFFYENVRELYIDMLNNFLWLIFYLSYKSILNNINNKKFNNIYEKIKFNLAKYLKSNIKFIYKIQLLLLIYWREGFMQYKRIEENMRRVKNDEN